MTSPNTADVPLPVALLDDAQRLACLRLIRSHNVGEVSFRKLINRFGGASQALDALPDIAARSGQGAKFKVCSKAQAEAELEAAEKVGAVPLFTIEPGFPKRLARIPAPPPMIYALGRIELLDTFSIAIVGARHASAAGVSMATEFARDLGQGGLTIVSGLARGIDGAAHKSSIDTGTIAVVAGGVDVVYPPEHVQLHHDIVERGCIISKQPCGFQPRGKDFIPRNRLISGMSLGVVVIEAARRSGTLTTARFAEEQGHDVFAVPGHPRDPRAEGTNYLLKEANATMVTEASDVLLHLRRMGRLQSPGFREPQPNALTDGTQADDYNAQSPNQLETAGATAISKDDSFGAESPVRAHPVPQSESENTTNQPRRATEEVARALGPAPVRIDDLIQATDLTAADVRTALIELELDGRLEHHGSGLISGRPLKQR